MHCERNLIHSEVDISIVKSFSVGNGDMFYIQHNSDNFTTIDCNFSTGRSQEIISELQAASKEKGMLRFISTHPDQDHISGIELLPNRFVLPNFYVVKNSAVKPDETTSFKKYCEYRDSESAYYIHKGCSRRWMNESNDERKSAGINVLWPDTSNPVFQSALKECNSGVAYNNVSAVFRYAIVEGASFLWLGDLETQYMEDIFKYVPLQKTTVVFAAHHGRKSGKIPNSWLEKLDPQIIVIGEAPSRELHYYTGYTTITQNLAEDITFDCEGEKVHIYCSSKTYSNPNFDDEGRNAFNYYKGSITVETEYTL